VRNRLHNRASDRGHHDVVIVGSGVGGSMAAYALVAAGLKVLMIERGGTIHRGPSNWAPDQALELSPHYTMESHYLIRGDDRGRLGTFQCVGGPSVFYGGVAYRMREQDFCDCPEVVGSSGAAWPYRYDDIEPYYGWAERILRVAGRSVDDVRAPRRSDPYPNRAPNVQGPARLIWDAAMTLGLSPSHLPLAIDFAGPLGGGRACSLCGTCDGYACAISAKREPATAVLPRLIGQGLTLLSNTVVVRILRRGGHVEGVDCVDRVTGRRHVFRGDRYILAAGALGSPHLILSSGLHTSSPARDWVGRCLMRHCNGIVFGLYPRPLEGSRDFHKQVGILDLYGGTDGRPKLGCIQSIHPPPPGLVRDRLPGFLRRVAEPLANHSTGLLVIAEDEPQRTNRVEASPSATDRYGIPRAVITHRYSARDRAARGALMRVAGAILRESGAWIRQPVHIKTFSHAVGSLRMGTDPRTSPLDRSSRFRGVENLWVTDGSFMPRSAAVNPSLTIAANALRAAEHVAGARILEGRIEAPSWNRPEKALHPTGGGSR
jgi:choline dehydrogenase-like flavoprotein